MNRFLKSTILFVIIQSHRASADSNLLWRIEEDLKALNVYCPLRPCSSQTRTSDSIRVYGCQCGAICAQYGTCCIDSPYINSPPTGPPTISPTCQYLGTDMYYTMDRCPSDSPWKSLCEEEWNGNDIVMKFVPVTSWFTNITYKNYFCFRCHETKDDFRYWNVELKATQGVLYKPIDKNNTVSLTYDRYNQTWLSPLGNGGSLVAVALNIKIPREILPLLVPCNKRMISNCSDTWSGEDVKKKCKAYMGVKYIQKNYTSYSYKNVHCAVCNFEELKEMFLHYDCKPSNVGVAQGGYGFASAFGCAGAGCDKVPFSFTFLIDINRSDGDLVGKIQRCGSTHVWDPFAEICRNLGCVLPGYVVRNGKCEAP